jgi:hypothetical protein
MANAQDINNNYNASNYYVVRSSAFTRVEFGSIQLPSFPVINAVLVEFHGGATYLYVGVPEALFLTLQAAVVTHVQTEGEYRLGNLFATSLFNSFPSYARLHQ